MNQQRDPEGRFASGPTAPEDDQVTLVGARQQLRELDPHRVDELIANADDDVAMAEDLIEYVRNSEASESAATWQEALNAATNAQPHTPGAITLDVREDCYDCNGSGLDYVVGGECRVCSGTRKITAQRSLQVAYADKDS